MKMSWIVKAALTIAMAIPAAAMAQVWPERPVRLVVPYPPGGASDTIARRVAHKLAERIGQPVVVENRAGAAGTIGADHVARSAADGYTLLLGNASELTIVPAVRKVGYDPVAGFTPVTLLARFPMVLVTHRDLPTPDLAAFLEHARKNAKSMNYATIGLGTTTHLVAESFRLTTGLPPMTPVPYRGGAPALQDVVAGHAPFMFDTLVSSMGQIQAGNVRGLAVTSAQRWPTLPNIPTVAESGFPGFDIGGWSGILAPAGLDAAIVDKLSLALQAVLREDDTRQAILLAGARAEGGTPADLAAFIRSELQKNTAVVKQAGITAD